MEILHYGHRLGQGHVINDQSWHLAHGIDFLVLLTALDPLDEVDRLHVHLYTCDVESNPHSPGARGAEVGVKLWLLLRIFVKFFNFLIALYIIFTYSHFMCLEMEDLFKTAKVKTCLVYSLVSEIKTGLLTHKNPLNHLSLSAFPTTIFYLTMVKQILQNTSYKTTADEC